MVLIVDTFIIKLFFQFNNTFTYFLRDPNTILQRIGKQVASTKYKSTINAKSKKVPKKRKNKILKITNIKHKRVTNM